MGEHRIVDIQEPAPGPSKPGEPQKEQGPSPSSVREDDRREKGETWPSLEEQRSKQKKSMKGSGA